MLPANGENVKLGAGSLLLGKYVNDVVSGFDFVGNASSVSIAAEVTNVQLFSNTQRSGALMAEATLRTVYTVSAVLNEFTMKNLQLWWKASQNTKTQSASTGRTVSFSNVVRGKVYDLGARQVENVVGVAGTEALVADSDYKLYAEYGLVHILPNAPHIADDGTEDIEFNFEQPALEIEQNRLNTEASQQAHLLFVSDDKNPEGVSSKDRLEIWRVNVAPDGELNLIGDEYGSFNLTMTIMDDSANHPNDPFGTLDRVAA